MPRLSTSIGIVFGALALVPSCSTSFRPRACAVDDDCGAGAVCVDTATTPTCTAASEAPLRIGMSAPITGPSQDLGIEMRKGVTMAFDALNAAGGIRGRQVQLEFRDDEYDSAAAEAAARDLLHVETTASPARCPTTTAQVAGNPPVAANALVRGSNAVLGLFGNVGTPTMVRAAPIAIETQSLFFGAFTGASVVLRDGSAGACSRYIFNVRASYSQEASATLAYFFQLGVPDAQHLVSFDQNDSFGQAGYGGLVAAYTAARGAITTPFADGSPIARFRYTRDDLTSVPAQVTAATRYLATILAADNQKHTVGIMMTDTYGPATTFIQGIRNWQYAADAEQTATQKASRLAVYFSNVSFVGPNSLASRLKDAGTVPTPSGVAKPYTDGVFVSQVVPNYQTDSSDGVRDFNAALSARGYTPSFTALEGYLSARIFVAGLAAHVGPFSPDALITTFEQLAPLNLGLGAEAGFTPQSHNYSKSVFGTGITPDGSFTDLYFWSEGKTIQLFE